MAKGLMPLLTCEHEILGVACIEFCALSNCFAGDVENVERYQKRLVSNYIGDCEFAGGHLVRHKSIQGCIPIGQSSLWVLAMLLTSTKMQLLFFSL